MIGADTNILVRLILNDDVAQVLTVRERAARARRERDAIYISPVCLVELAWTLQRKRYASRADVIAAITMFMETPPFVMFDREAVEVALGLFEGGKAGFADALIASMNDKAGCASTLTFD